MLLRAGIASGACVAVVTPASAAAQAVVPPGVEVLGVGGARGAVVEEVAGRRWRVSAGSFFQCGPGPASRIVEAVERAVGDVVQPRVAEATLVVDLYAGVGLLGGAVAARHDARLLAVEYSASAAADARHNLADLDARVVQREVGRWRTAERPAVVIADPARPGLGRPGARAVAAVGTCRVVLVSCDPASFARDAALLAQAGWSLSAIQIVGAFPHTAHWETVARFDVT